MSKKSRPPNAPGPNGLRGGRNIYSLKTAVGNWIEDSGGSSVFKRGFHADSFQTECQHQQSGRDLVQDPKFGADLPVKYIDPRTTNDIFNPPAGPQPTTWQTNTQLMLKNSGNRVLQTSNQTAKQTIAPEALEAYRKQWTNDTPESVAMRFQTESRRAGNGSAKKEFQVRSIRYLPGTPIAFERFRDRLIERYGILGMSCVRNAIANRAEVSSAEYFQLIKATGVEMSRTEIQQMLAYLTPTDVVLTGKLMSTLRGLLSDNSDISPVKIYDAIIYNNGNQPLLIDQCRLFINSGKYPDIAAGLELFIVGYGRGNGSDAELTLEGFQLLCSDMYNSDNSNYINIMQDLWTVM